MMNQSESLGTMCPRWFFPNIKMYEKEILELYKLCDIRSFPINCLAIIRGIGFSVKTYGELAKTKENLLLLHSVSSDAFTYFDKRLIVYNEREYRRRIRFTLMHEVGHIVLDTDSEDEADAFASEILAPLPIVTRYGHFDVDDICRRFDVSVAMANRVMMATNKKAITDKEGILRYFQEKEREDQKQSCVQKVKKHNHPPCKAPDKNLRPVKLSARTVKAIAEREQFIRNNPQIRWDEVQFIKREMEVW